MQVSIRSRIPLTDATRAKIAKVNSSQLDVASALRIAPEIRILSDLYIFRDNSLAESAFSPGEVYTSELMQQIIDLVLQDEDGWVSSDVELSDSLDDFLEGMKDISKNFKFLSEVVVAFNE